MSTIDFGVWLSRDPLRVALCGALPLFPAGITSGALKRTLGGDPRLPRLQGSDVSRTLMGLSRIADANLMYTDRGGYYWQPAPLFRRILAAHYDQFDSGERSSTSLCARP